MAAAGDRRRRGRGDHGDWLTIEKVPIPLVWLRDRSKRWGLAAFRTGGVVESALITPGLSLATILLTGRAVGVI